MRRRKEGNRTVQSANPDLGRARIEIESAFFVDFGGRIGGGKDLNADLWGACKEERLLGNLGPIGSEPGNIDSLDTVGSGDWALSKNEALREQLGQKTANGKLTARVAESFAQTAQFVQSGAADVGLLPLAVEVFLLWPRCSTVCRLQSSPLQPQLRLWSAGPKGGHFFAA